MKVQRINNEYRLSLTAEAGERLRLHEGDVLSLERTDEGLTLRSQTPEDEAFVQAGLDFRDRYDETFRNLST